MRGGPVFLLSAQTFRWESSNPGSTSFLTGSFDGRGNVESEREREGDGEADERGRKIRN